MSACRLAALLADKLLGRTAEITSTGASAGVVVDGATAVETQVFRHTIACVSHVV